MLLLLVSVLANLFFINSRLMARRRRKQEKDRFPNQLKRYMKEQSRITLNAKHNLSVPELDPLVSKCRGAYLMIEAKAVDYGIGSQEYWNFISAKLKDLLEILHKYDFSIALKSIEKKIVLIKKLVDRSPDITDKDVIFSCLDNFYHACRKNPDKTNLMRYERKLNTLLKRLSDKNLTAIEDMVDAHSSFSDAAESALTRHGAQSRKVSKKRLRDGFSDVNQIDDIVGKYMDGDETINRSISNILNESRAAGASMIEVMMRDRTGVDKAVDSESAKHLLELSESLQQRSETEIKNLKKVVRDQREAIYLLEGELTQLKKKGREPSSVQNSAQLDEASRSAEAELKILKNNLRESEYCIEVLESELDELRDRVLDKPLEPVPGVDQRQSAGAGEAVPAKELIDTVRQLENAVNQSGQELTVLRTFRDFVEEAIRLESIEDLAMQTYVTLHEMGFVVQFMVSGLEREFVVSANGSITAKDQSILRSLSVSESSLSSTKNKLYCRYKYLSCAAAVAESDEINEESVVQIQSFVKTANDIISRIHQTGRQRTILRSLDKEYNTIKASTSDVEKILNTAFQNLGQVTRDGMKMIQDSARVNGASAPQIAKMRTIEQEILDEIESQKSVSLKVKKVLLGLLSGIDKLFNPD